MRGLKVGLDRWEMAADTDDSSVETWIAETIMSSEARMFVISSEALSSGWVNREIEWELRLLGARRAMSLPFVLIADQNTPLSLEGYPRARVAQVADIEGRNGNAALDELAERIVLDGVLQIQTVKDGNLRGLPK
jgi:hypothetical protein